MRPILLALCLALAARQAPSPAKSLNTLIDDVDRTFASMKYFSADFVQISTISVNQRQQAEGHVYLTRDRKMRWDYRKPEVKLYVSDGKTLYSYVPLNREVSKEQVKDSMAERIPMMFLIGRAGLRKEFTGFALVNSEVRFEGDQVIRLTPTRKNADIERMEIEVNPRSNLIVRMLVVAKDKSSNEIIFSNADATTPIPSATFEFTPPAGIRVVQGVTFQ